MLRRNGKLVVVSEKTVDNIFLTCVQKVVQEVIERLNNHFKLGNIGHGPNNLRHIGLKINQESNFDMSIDGFDELQCLQSY